MAGMGFRARSPQPAKIKEESKIEKRERNIRKPEKPMKKEKLNSDTEIAFLVLLVHRKVGQDFR